jgi:hypothetical protein
MLVAYKPYAQLDEQFHILGILPESPYMKQEIRDEEEQAFVDLGYIVVTQEEYDALIAQLEPLNEISMENAYFNSLTLFSYASYAYSAIAGRHFEFKNDYHLTIRNYTEIKAILISSETANCEISILVNDSILETLTVLSPSFRQKTEIILNSGDILKIKVVSGNIKKPFLELYR